MSRILSSLFFAFVFLQACTQVPKRPRALSEVEKKGYDDCERDYSVCLQGNMPVDKKVGTEPHNNDPQLYGNYYGIQPHCNDQLKKCYARESQAAKRLNP